MNFFNPNNQQQQDKEIDTDTANEYKSLLNVIAEHRKEVISLRETERLFALFEDNNMYSLSRYCAKKDEAKLKQILKDNCKQSDFVDNVIQFINANQDYLSTNRRQHQTYLISVLENDTELKTLYNIGQQNQARGCLQFTLVTI